jgi:hypothetical protein
MVATLGAGSVTVHDAVTYTLGHTDGGTV